MSCSSSALAACSWATSCSNFWIRGSTKSASGQHQVSLTAHIVGLTAHRVGLTATQSRLDCNNQLHCNTESASLQYRVSFTATQSRLHCNTELASLQHRVGCAATQNCLLSSRQRSCQLHMHRTIQSNISCQSLICEHAACMHADKCRVSIIYMPL